MSNVDESVREVGEILDTFNNGKREDKFFASIDHQYFESDIVPLIKGRDTELNSIWRFIAGDVKLPLSITKDGEEVIRTPPLINTMILFNPAEGGKGLTDDIGHTKAAPENDNASKVKLVRGMKKASKGHKANSKEWENFFNAYEDVVGVDIKGSKKAVANDEDVVDNLEIEYDL